MMLNRLYYFVSRQRLWNLELVDYNFERNRIELKNSVEQ